MERLITDFNTTGLVMSGKELENERRKRGECVTCGRKCYQKKLLRMIPITDHGRVLNGRCLNCKPLDATTDGVDVLPAAIRPATREDLSRFAKSQSNLNLTAGSSSFDGARISGSSGGSRRSSAASGGRRRPPASASQSVRTLGSAQSVAGDSVLSAPASLLHSAATGGTASSGLSEAISRLNSEEARAATSFSTASSELARRRTSNQAEEGSSRRLVPHHSADDVLHQPRPASQAPGEASLPYSVPREAVSDSETGGSEARGRLPRGGSERIMMAHANGSGQPQPQPQPQPRYASRDSSFDEYDSYSDRSGASYRDPHGELQEAHPRMHCTPGIDEDEAYELAASHPAGAALIDYYNRFHRETSARSVESAGSHQHSVEPSHRGRLNRGGQVAYPGSVSGNSSGESAHSLRSGRHAVGGSDGYAHGLPADDRPVDRFVGEDLLLPQRHGAPAPSRGPIVDPRLGAHLARIAAEDTTSGRYPGNDDALSTSQHTAHSRQSRHSHQSHRSNRNAAPSARQYPSSLGDTNLVDSHTAVTLVGSTGSPYDQHSGSFGSGTARDGAGLDRIRAAGADFAEIVNVMLDFPDSPPVQSTGMQELSNLQLTRADADTFMHLGAHQVIINGMKSFPMDVELQISGCRAMWNASGTSSNQIIFVESGAIDVILFAMGQYAADADVQEQAMATLANLAAVEANTQTMLERGVVSAIVEAMNKHSDNAHVQAKGCAVITNMASHTTLIKRSIMNLGGGGSVVVAMVMHPKDPQLQEKALRALRNLSANCDENKIELATIGGIDSVISAMQVHRDEAGVQESGAWTLSNIAGPPENKAMIGEYGGVDVTIRAMWVHSDNIRVQEWCCRALFTLSLDPQNAALIQEVGGISAIVNAMQAHVDTAVIQEMGCAVLCNLAADTAAKIRIVDEEALDVIVLAMVLHSEDAKIQERGCQVLLQLSIIENCKAMQASNIGELAMAAAERFPAQCGEIANHLLHLLESFVEEYNKGA